MLFNNKMIHAYCDVINIGNEVYFRPRESHSINYNCLVDRDHITYDYHIGQIFDFRKELMNHCFSGNMHLYCLFYDDDKNTPDLSDIEAVATISTYEREKTRVHGRKKLEYKNYSNLTFQTYPVKNKNTYLLYLGYAEDMNFREVAYETPGCFSSHISPDGCGYISVNLITNHNIGFKNALLLGFSNKIQESQNENIPQAIALNIEENVPVLSIEAIEYDADTHADPIPTAPAFICQPSAPPLIN